MASKPKVAREELAFVRSLKGVPQEPKQNTGQRNTLRSQLQEARLPALQTCGDVASQPHRSKEKESFQQPSNIEYEESMQADEFHLIRSSCQPCSSQEDHNVPGVSSTPEIAGYSLPDTMHMESVEQQANVERSDSEYAEKNTEGEVEAVGVILDQFMRQGMYNPDASWECEEVEKSLQEAETEYQELIDDIENDSYDYPFDDNDTSVLEDTEHDNEPMAPNCPISVGVSLLMIITFAMQYKLSGEAISGLLCLIQAHLAKPIATAALNSLDAFKKSFRNLKNPVTYHRYCSNCLLLLGDDNTETCPNGYCLKDLKEKGAVSYFIEIPIATQIQNFFKKPSFWSDIEYRFTRQKKGADCIEDIYDGELYKQMVRKGILSNKQNLSLTWNTDGVPVFKSSKVSMWPLYFIVNELPFGLRTKRENMIFGGLWFGDMKPAMMTFLQPFHTSLRQLETDGVSVSLPDGETFISRVVLLAGSCDLPAKSLVCNTIQYNGAYGCAKCKQVGKTVKTSERGHVHAFPFIADNPSGPRRTKECMAEDAKEAVNRGKTVNGVKGPSWFAALKSYDIALGTGVDYMHCVLSGITKLFCTLWFKSPKNKAYNQSDKLTKVDERLVAIKPPSDISRPPRSIEHHLNYWKASEFRAFLLFYGPVVLYGVLDPAYYEHFMLLSEAIFILLMDSIPDEMLKHATRLLEHFCLTFEHLYEPRYQTINVHSLLHLVDDVRNLGPLWTHSCFHFEDKNGYILKLIHGTQNFQSQITSAVSIVQRMPELVHEYLVEGTEAMSLYQRLTGTSPPSNETRLFENIYALGATYEHNVTLNELEALTNLFGEVPRHTSVLAFKRIRIGKHIFHSQMYKKPTIRNNCTVMYMNRQGRISYGLVGFYFQCRGLCMCVDECSCEWKNYAMVQLLQQRNVQLVHDRITQCTGLQVKVVEPPSNQILDVVPIANIFPEKCIFVLHSDRPDQGYVTRFPNSLEKD